MPDPRDKRPYDWAPRARRAPPTPIEAPTHWANNPLDGVEVCAVCRPIVTELVCGDAWQVFHLPKATLVALVDGTGHGPRAAEAAQKALQTLSHKIALYPDVPLDSLMRSCHDALAGTRGAAISLCRIETRPSPRMSYCAVGSNELRTFPDRAGVGIGMPGMVGYHLHRVRVFETELWPADLLVLHTDGVSQRFTVSEPANQALDQLALRLEREQGKYYDDATVVAVRIPRHQPRQTLAALKAGYPSPV